jgi:hypothetical protein
MKAETLDVDWIAETTKLTMKGNLPWANTHTRSATNRYKTFICTLFFEVNSTGALL